MADRENTSKDDENLVGIQSRCEATELDATSRAELGEVNHSVLADVDREHSAFLGSFDFGVELANRMQGTPLATIPTLGILTEQNRREAIAEASNLLAPIKNLGGRRGLNRSASVDSHMDSSLRCTAHTDRTLCTDGLEEAEEFKNMGNALVAFENWGNELALFESVGRADRGVFIGFPSLTSEAGSLNDLAVGEGHLGNGESVAVVANPNGEVSGDLGFDLDSEGRLVVYHTSDYALF